MQAVSLVERPRACIVHPSEQCAAAALNSLELFESAGDRPRGAVSRLLLAVEGVGANARREAGALLARAHREFTALGDSWGQAVVAFVQMEAHNKRGNEAEAEDRQPRRPACSVSSTTAGGCRRAVPPGVGSGPVRPPRRGHRGLPGGHRGRRGGRCVQHGAMGHGRPGTVPARPRAGRGGLRVLLHAGAVSDQVGDDAGKALAVYGAAVLAQDGATMPRRVRCSTRRYVHSNGSGFPLRPAWRWPGSPPVTNRWATSSARAPSTRGWLTSARRPASQAWS